LAGDHPATGDQKILWSPVTKRSPALKVQKVKNPTRKIFFLFQFSKNFIYLFFFCFQENFFLQGQKNFPSAAWPTCGKSLKHTDIFFLFLQYSCKGKKN